MDGERQQRIAAARHDVVAAAERLATQGLTPFTRSDLVREARRGGSTLAAHTLRSTVGLHLRAEEGSAELGPRRPLARVGPGRYRLAERPAPRSGTSRVASRPRRKPPIPESTSASSATRPAPPIPEPTSTSSATRPALPRRSPAPPPTPDPPPSPDPPVDPGVDPASRSHPAPPPPVDPASRSHPAPDPDPDPDPTSTTPAPSPRPTVEPATEDPGPGPAISEGWWSAEGVARLLQSALVRDGWTVADPARAVGPTPWDLAATNEGTVLLVSIEGAPVDPTQRRTGAVDVDVRVWFADALLGALTTRSGHTEARVALALPALTDYATLAREVAPTLRAVGVEVWLIGEDARVTTPAP